MQLLSRLEVSSPVSAGKTLELGRKPNGERQRTEENVLLVFLGVRVWLCECACPLFLVVVI